MIFTDQLNRKIELTETPKRIISLVPSQTELLYDLGLRDEVVGITKFCIHPKEWFHTKTRIGGTKKFDFDKIKLLNPDLIIGNKEENEQVQIEELSKHYKVWMSDIVNLSDALDMILRVGTMVEKQEEAINLKLRIENMFKELPIQNTISNRQSAAYFIWNNPYMIAGNNTFIDDMLSRCGFTNVFASPNLSRYPEVSKEQILKANPQVTLLSSEPYPFKEKHVEEIKNICPKTNIIIVDGELFSWYGSRLLLTPPYFTKLIQSLM